MTSTAKNLRLFVLAADLAAFGAVYGGSVFASDSFEAGVSGETIPDNTHVRIDSLTLSPGAVPPLYDARPNFVSGHFLLRAPCDPDTHVPNVTVIASHIDESMHGTYVDKMPLYYISQASTVDSCVYHAHMPDPLNIGAPKITEVALINLSNEDVTFSAGDGVDINVQRVLGSMSNAPYEEMKVPANLEHGNPVFDLNDNGAEDDGQ